jgi:hypothetical protein
VTLGQPDGIKPETIVHRVGGGRVENLRLSALDRQEEPPGISVLLGGTPQEAADQMRAAFPGSRKWLATADVVGTTTAEAIRQVGFEILPDPTNRFSNHARLIHPEGEAGFTDERLELLSKIFKDTAGC